ncbi:bifunctional ornithine acetyltransferase/N-acetylglutamate synthase [Oleiphilus sp. HI0009]|nr:MULTISPECIES: bifunctional glutamate N-acetyltransferase/amino-acid acetyltransferase ArgJ [unclassified Oleiphilus]KZX81391.1 bifunctional ornithine acetyltransferase/N-acetylglutamate synthase [Oleiphilus sp. HI0009]KZY65787.1 bifunctional ornithine acetyltransferase/N-acetylglutamate synthase [Oleiphilus sp. HI0066]KZY75561.1 bifunctional ornithine acetyltransferase/N-acetylglutamate synthase [Oleiphilus sp. HI0067]MCH2159630.1 bifunctional glutamate N-acetyltransferase/amino-acid acetylt
MAVGADFFPEMPPIKGLKIGVVEAGVRYADRKDLVLFSAEAGSRVAGVFTKNAFCAAPVHIAKKHLSIIQQQDQPFSLLINTGNANAGTGEQGFIDAQACCEAIAEQFSYSAEQVLPFSTGVIGEKLAEDRICTAAPSLKNALNDKAWHDAGLGIMTTDTRPKGASVQLEYAGKTVTINGISKGAGMIKPNMATMLCFISTDAKLPQDLLNELSSELADRSFNRITIDGDTSTNDACMLIATGQAMDVEISKNDADYVSFKTALSDIYLELAHAIVRDGEGATKFVTIQVEQANSANEALDLAYTIAHSPLVKTALFASDPNWGRILAALGRAPIDNLDLDKVQIYLGDVMLVENGGRAQSYSEEKGQAIMDEEEILIRLVLNRGIVNETVWTTDLSHQYVTINAEYRT